MSRDAHPTKEAREVHQLLVARGWRLEIRSGRHITYRYPENGALLVVARTSSDHRARANLLARAKRLEAGVE